MTDKELIKWSRSIADACMRTTIKPEEVETACEAYMQAKQGKMTNYEKYFGTPEKAAEQMNGCDAITAQFKWQRTISEEERAGKTYLQLAIEWLKEESE